MKAVATRLCWGSVAALLAAMVLGCTGASQSICERPLAAPASQPMGGDSLPKVATASEAPPDPHRDTPRVTQVAYEAHQPAVAPSAPMPGASTSNAAEGTLDLDALIQQVQSVNPSLEAAVEAWHAAAYRYPQMISLDDPMFGFMKGTEMGWMVEASQKIPWPGKRRLRGNMAAAEADAMQWDVEDTRLMLAEAAAMAFFDYYQAGRQLVVNAATTRVVREFRDTAKVMYEANRVSQQDVLQADVELAELEARQAEIQQDRKIATARINTLLHREADHPLAPPPAEVAAPSELPDRESMTAMALESRPDLAAQMARIRQEEYALALAHKEFYPDLEFAAKHDHFMPSEMQNQVGMNFNLPLYRQKRNSAVCEASAKLRQQRAELEGRIDRVRFEVESAWQRTDQRRTVARLYEQKILPAAEAAVQSARINYSAGKVDFLRLLEAERQLRQQQEKYHETVADCHRRLAQLQRAVGAPLPR